VADALSWAVSHAEGRVTQAIGIALTTPIYEFATHPCKPHPQESVRRRQPESRRPCSVKHLELMA
jgi:hypothetical protein